MCDSTGVLNFGNYKFQTVEAIFSVLLENPNYKMAPMTEEITAN